LSGLFIGLETDVPELDFLEAMHSLLELQSGSTSICVGINRDLLSMEQQTIYRDLKSNNFGLVLEVNKN